MSIRIRRAALGTVVAASVLALGTGSSAHASHAHFIYQPANGNHPATCRYIAEGQTSKTFDEPGGHKFHEHVHTGTPGTDGNGTSFDKAGNAALPKYLGCVWFP